MKIYDISQEILSCEVYPGDPVPQKTQFKSIDNGDLYNLSAFSMCAHNGTHIDAPRHFISGGKTIDEIALNVFVGMAYVASHNGIVTAEDATKILKKAHEINEECVKRILIKGDIEVSLEAAKVFASSNLLLLGNEPQTVGPKNEPMAVHIALLSANVTLLEGVRLAEVGEGVYFLNAAPLNLLGIEGSPCRAILVDLEG